MMLPLQFGLTPFSRMIILLFVVGGLLKVCFTRCFLPRRRFYAVILCQHLQLVLKIWCFSRWGLRTLDLFWWLLLKIFWYKRCRPPGVRLHIDRAIFNTYCLFDLMFTRFCRAQYPVVWSILIIWLIYSNAHLLITSFPGVYNKFFRCTTPAPLSGHMWCFEIIWDLQCVSVVLL